jgi:hypothetical protein
VSAPDRLFDAPAQDMERYAEVEGPYRYELGRRWDPDGDAVLFVMLNPSTADADTDDPTLTRCIGFARSWGFGGVLVGNLFAYRTSEPPLLADARRRGVDIVGPENDEALRAMRFRRETTLVVAAWGAFKPLHGRDQVVLDMLGAVHAIRVTQGGRPEHPLYLPGSSRPQPFRNGSTVEAPQ